jgi:hypothetical protein
MEPNVGADIHMLVNESDFFTEKKKKKSRKVSNNSEFSLEK